MPRPDSVTSEDISRWSTNIDNDPNLTPSLTQNLLIREVCLAGLFLAEQLEKLNCSYEYILRVQFTAGRLSFGRDPWQVAQQMIKSYELGELDFEDEGKLN